MSTGWTLATSPERTSLNRWKVQAYDGSCVWWILKRFIHNPSLHECMHGMMIHWSMWKCVLSFPGTFCQTASEISLRAFCQTTPDSFLENFYQAMSAIFLGTICQHTLCESQQIRNIECPCARSVLCRSFVDCCVMNDQKTKHNMNVATRWRPNDARKMTMRKISVRWTELNLHTWGYVTQPKIEKSNQQPPMSLHTGSNCNESNQERVDLLCWRKRLFVM